MNAHASMQGQNGLPTSPNQMSYLPMDPKSKQKRRTAKQNSRSKDGVYSNKPNGVHPKPKTKPKKKSAPNGKMLNSEGSSVGTVSPGNSIDSPPNGYDMTPPAYDSVCGNMVSMSQSNIHLGVPVTCAMSQNSIDDHTVMANHYKSSLPHDWLEHHPMTSFQGSTGSVLSPPNSNQSHGSPIGHGKHSPGKMKMLPLSPTHMQAMQQRAKQYVPPITLNQQTDNYPFHSDNIVCTNDIYRQKLQPSTQISQTPVTIEQYPTPPSQHSYSSSESPPQILGPPMPDNYLTPSPDSPGQSSWSSSPHSAHSDWSDRISSPVQLIGHMQNHSKHLAEPVYI